MSPTAIPPLLLTLGDPAGIGPEIVARLARAGALEEDAVIVGDAGALARAWRALGGEGAFRIIGHPSEIRSGPGPAIIQTGPPLPDDLPLGRVDARAGAAAFAAIEAAIDFCLSGEARGLVTAPISKEALKRAGVPFPGHTEILADRCGVPDAAMMLANESLRVLLVSIHVPLRAALEAVTFESELRAIRAAAIGARALGVAQPRIAVAGLNPHAGENGQFGDEDLRLIAPAVAAAQADGLDATGPHPPDTVFMRARAGEFDIVVAQYHDQGLIPVKYLGLDKGVNVTVGLPFVRTSVDHGTAFDIAGRGLADPSSLAEALRLARVMTAAAAPSPSGGALRPPDRPPGPRG